MVITVEIDDKSKTGKSILQLLKDLSKSSDSIHFIDTVEDKELLQDIKQALKSGRISKSIVSGTIKTILNS
jgi:hypothetical protein